jgi:hypothetical protein
VRVGVDTACEQLAGSKQKSGNDEAMHARCRDDLVNIPTIVMVNK